jgi:hypothetical protein
MNAGLIIIMLLLLGCGVAWSYLAPIREGVDLRYPEYSLSALEEEQEWETHFIQQESVDLEKLSLEKQRAREEERRRISIHLQLERERGNDIDVISQRWFNEAQQRNKAE